MLEMDPTMLINAIPAVIVCRERCSRPARLFVLGLKGEMVLMG
jgi:hypothetical protein